MKSIDYKGTEIEITAIRFVYGNEETVQEGILLHDSTDTYHDGDAIYGNGWTLDQINDESDVESLLASTEGTTYFNQTEDGIYRVGA